MKHMLHGLQMNFFLINQNTKPIYSNYEPPTRPKLLKFRSNRVTASRRPKEPDKIPYVPLQHRNPCVYESFADIFAQEGGGNSSFFDKSAASFSSNESIPATPSLQGISFDVFERPRMTQNHSAFTSGPSTSSQGRDNILARRSQARLKSLLSAHTEAEMAAVSTGPKVYDADGFVIPATRPASRASTACSRSPGKPHRPTRPVIMTAISSEAVICRSTSSTRSARSSSRSDISTPAQSPMLTPITYSALSDEKELCAESWSLIDEEEDSDEEVNLRTILRRRSRGRSSTSHELAIGALRANLSAAGHGKAPAGRVGW